jgi:hypothetical protein
MNDHHAVSLVACQIAQLNGLRDPMACLKDAIELVAAAKAECPSGVRYIPKPFDRTSLETKPDRLHFTAELMLASADTPARFQQALELTVRECRQRLTAQWLSSVQPAGNGAEKAPGGTVGG